MTRFPPPQISNLVPRSRRLVTCFFGGSGVLFTAAILAYVAYPYFLSCLFMFPCIQPPIRASHDFGVEYPDRLCVSLYATSVSIPCLISLAYTVACVISFLFSRVPVLKGLASISSAVHDEIIKRTFTTRVACVLRRRVVFVEMNMKRHALLRISIVERLRRMTKVVGTSWGNSDQE